MLAQELRHVANLEVSYENQDNTLAFLQKAKACLSSFLECDDIEIAAQVQQDLGVLQDKIIGIRQALGIDAMDLRLEQLRAFCTQLERLLLKCKQQTDCSNEFHELCRIQQDIQNEVEELQRLIFELTESHLTPNSKRDKTIGKTYANLKTRLDPLKASVQFISMRVEGFKANAVHHFPVSVAFLTSESSKLTSQVHQVVQEFGKVEILLRQEWWDPLLEKPKSPEKDGNFASSIPIFNLTLRGQRKSPRPASYQPQPFQSKIPKPTIVERPASIGGRVSPIFRARGHYRTSSQWSTSSSRSSESITSPKETEQSRPGIFDQVPLLLPPTSTEVEVPKSRLARPTPVDLGKIRIRNKENDEQSRIPVSISRRTPIPLSTIRESPNLQVSSSIPKHLQSPTNRPHRLSQLYSTPVRRT